jgi:hypothetical protein
MNHSIFTNRFNEIQVALEELDKEKIEVEGKFLKPGQCYHLGIDPPHILYNTNCPDSLKQKIEAILLKYKEQDEISS